MNSRIKTAAAVSAAILAMWAGAFSVSAVDNEPADAESTEIIVTDSQVNPVLEGTGDVVINSTNFPDETFRNYVAGFDKDENGSLSQSELNAVASIGVSGAGIEDLTGIEHFTKLAILSCDYNQLTSLDLSKNTELQKLYCDNNQLTSLDLSKNTVLKDLCCNDNQLTSLVLSNSTNNTLLYLYCYNNQLTSLDVSKYTALKYLYCNNNQLTSLDVSQNTALEGLKCYYNQLTSLDVSQNTALWSLNCDSNQLTSLDVSQNTAFRYLYCSNNTFSIGDVINSYSLANLPGFDPEKASDWTGAECDRSTKLLKNFTSNTVTYNYDCGKGHTATFTLLANSYTKLDPPSFEVKGVFGGRNVTFNCTTPDATIYYTDENRSTLKLTDPHVAPGETVLFKAYYGTVYARAYYNGKWSNPARLILKIPKVKTPTITKLDNGKYKIKTTTPGTIVYYTIDGTTPSATNYKGKFWTSHDVSIPSGKTVKAIAVRTCFSDSDVATAKT